MTASNDLKYLTTILDRGGPSGPSEMQQVIVVVRRLAQRITELEALADTSANDEALAELQTMHTELTKAHAKLQEELDSKKTENRTLKSKITRLEKKVQSDDTSS